MFAESVAEKVGMHVPEMYTAAWHLAEVLMQLPRSRRGRCGKHISAACDECLNSVWVKAE